LAVDGSKGSDPIKMQMTGLSMDVDSRMGKFGLSVGDSAIKIKRIYVTKPDVDVKVTLDNFGYTVKLSEDDKNINIQAAYQTGELNV
ncbi:DUF945 family protein, partial [Klebsiella pneumoniae]|uniref:DUF945 family protein n=1 Tax=Klebsiella pneumoniae TaxID=573 RepID=UPI003B59B391